MLGQGVYRLNGETDADVDEVEYLLDTCFAPGREALSSYRLRDGIDPVQALCLIARDDDGVLAGAIRYWPVQIGQGGAPALLLGPVAVHPTRQGEGLGALLIEESLARAAGLGWVRALLIGDEPYYRRFGFAVNRTLAFPPPTNPDRLLTRALVEGSWDGISGDVRRARP